MHDMAMGTLDLTRAELEDAYAFRPAHKLAYGLWLRGQPHGELLK
jgi:hypothetical protein